jgi:hypothetical protein
MKVVRLSALNTGCLYSHTKDSWYSFLLQADSIPGPSTARKSMSMKNSNDTIRNRTRNLPACSTVPQPTAIPRATCSTESTEIYLVSKSKFYYQSQNRHTHCLLYPIFQCIWPMVHQLPQSTRIKCFWLRLNL